MVDFLPFCFHGNLSLGMNLFLHPKQENNLHIIDHQNHFEPSNDISTLALFITSRIEKLDCIRDTPGNADSQFL